MLYLVQRMYEFGNILGGPFYDPRLPYRFYWGPFDTVHDFHKALLDDMDLSTPCGLPEVSELLEYYWRYQGELVFTHGDLSGLNILVRGDDVVGIVDWETAGWYPGYWEYTCRKN